MIVPDRRSAPERSVTDIYKKRAVTMSMYDVAERSGARLRYLFGSLLNKASSLAEKDY
jgi:hypothetical protein